MTKFKCDNRTRIFAFHWISCKTFMICQRNELVLWLFSNRECKTIQTFDLPVFKDNWSTSVCHGQKGTYIVGDRKGHLYIYSLAQNNPIQVIRKAHNHLGVTQIYSLSKQIITLGRNSVIRTFTGDSHPVMPIITDKTPFAWLAAMQENKVLAFSGNNFIVWDYINRRIVFEYNCSGGHRSWDFYERFNETSFVYVKDRALNIVDYKQNDIYPLNLISGFHATTINYLRVLHMGLFYFLVSGGEDTTLRITLINDANSCILKILKSHLSSIRAICIWPLSAGNYLIFSGGGRGQIITWCLTIDNDNYRNTTCREEHSYYENISSYEESEVRIMDIQVAIIHNILTLFVATSEGNIKVFNIIENNKKFELSLKYTLCYKKRCVTKICILQNSNLDILISFSTDGSAAFWNLQIEGKSPIIAFPLHQSGINALSFHFIDSQTVVLLSGGDDACIKLTKFIFRETTVVEKTVLFEDVRQHCAQITGLFMNDKYFITTSVDQKLLVFRWRIENNDDVKCYLMGKYESAVADIQGMDCYEDELTFSVFLYGKGFEFVIINKI